MRVLVVGGGGREHALAWKIKQSPLCDALLCAPGNAGMEELADCAAVDVGDIDETVKLAKEWKADFVVVGPEAPLAAGLVDALKKEGVSAFGPSRRAAELESSKVFARSLMSKHNVPQPEYRVFTSYSAARAYVEERKPPVVVKADGLAAGKGSFVCFDVDDMLDALEQAMKEKRFGASGDRVLVEEYMEGEEVSLLALTDGKTIVPLQPAQDYKRVFDDGLGPNTGGMGAYSPPACLTQDAYRQVEKRILVPTIHGMNAEGRPFSGVLYAGLILTDDGPRVLEFNVRFGDPETQPLVLRLKSDLLEALHLCAEGRLEEARIEWDERPAVCVVLASGGYPGKYRTGFPIEGLEEAGKVPGVVVFHAGTRREGPHVVTAGGRVLGVTATGEDMEEARERVYEAIGKISFPDMHYRRDIAEKAL